jgi:hypothetical protein
VERPTEVEALGIETIAPMAKQARGPRWKTSLERGEGLAAARGRSRGGGGAGDLRGGGGGGGALGFRL